MPSSIIYYHMVLPASVLYGLPKVHKLGCLFRPIVSSINTYNYSLASYFVRILQPISKNPFTIKDSFSFADWTKTVGDTQNSILDCFTSCFNELGNTERFVF